MKSIISPYVTSAFLLLFVFFTQSSAIFAQNSEVRLSKVRVLLTPNGIFDEETVDPSIYPDPDFEVYLRRAGHLHKMLFEDYKFRAEVPEGVYEILLKSSEGQLINYKRANFVVSHNFTRTLKLELTEGKESCDAAHGFVMYPIVFKRINGRFSESVRRGKSPKFDKLRTNRPLNVVINFCKKSTASDRNIYEFARLSYNDVTIYAHKIISDRNGTFFRIYGIKDDPIMIDVNGCVVKKDIPSTKLNIYQLASLKCQ
jgi:hypothetical protein